MPTSDRRQFIVAGTAVYAVALLLRLLPVFFIPSIHYPDEIFQTLEPAHRLVFGTGLVPWEWLYGTRSWVLPGFLAGFMAIARGVGAGPALYMPLIGIALAALGAASALCAFLWGHRFHGLWGGVLAGALVACWIDAVYFGPRTLNEAVAGHVLVIGLYLAAPGRPVTGRARLILAGLLLGVAALLRIQLAPAVAFFALWSWSGMAPLKTRLGPLILGGAIALFLFGAVDWATWGYPFASLWRNVLVNLVYGVSANWGSQPVIWYVAALFAYWSGVAVLILLLARLGAMDLPQPALTALVIFIIHSAIGHKEWRFIYPAVLLAVISAGLGLARLVDWLADGLLMRGMARPAALRAIAGPALLVAVLSSVGLSAATPYRQLWTRDADVVRASHLVSRLPGVCGIALYGIDWFNSGGYSLMNQKAPIYWSDAAGMAAHSDAFNVVVTAEKLPEDTPFRSSTCFRNVCVVQRPGSCAALPMTPLETPPGLDKIQPLIQR